MIPNGGVRTDFHSALSTPIPVLDAQLPPGELGLVEQVLEGGTARPFEPWPALLSWPALWRGVVQGCIQAQPGDQADPFELTDPLEQDDHGKTTIGHKDPLPPRQPATHQLNGLLARSVSLWCARPRWW